MRPRVASYVLNPINYLYMKGTSWYYGAQMLWRVCNRVLVSWIVGKWLQAMKRECGCRFIYPHNKQSRLRVHLSAPLQVFSPFVALVCSSDLCCRLSFIDPELGAHLSDVLDTLRCNALRGKRRK
ncbi:hypothetical protein XELAEV_18038030mg [Xenopus laevis]|uniref:Uncharacterized protein n=1 Tax=Xenopus laevis TaxID=8355 RepID=A0A974CEE0_XENLA|nr:hypothetical protein XELAEV_18038030mg [Xenopus laevis]